LSNITWRFGQNRDLQGAEVVLTDESQAKFLVAVIGAGPAGLYAAKQLTSEGVRVVLLNRDVKPGGLAEYGIYPDKHKMKEGLRNQFRMILASPLIDYYGNVQVGKTADISLDELLALGFQALLVTVGAQGTKWLGIPGEELSGVYHAKDIVYHYNQLPPFSESQFHVGNRVAVVGAGNVMLDIAHWLIQEKKVTEVTAVVRRGPAEVKFTRTELEYVAKNLDYAAYETELERVRPVMEAVGQDASKPREVIQAAIRRALDTGSNTRFRLEFLESPVRLHGDGAGHVSGFEVEDNFLELVNGEVKARGLGVTRVLDVDTVIFAIGDRVDDRFGLPTQGNEFGKHPQPRFPVEGLSYELYDVQNSRPLPGFFVAGWSRQASTGLVGVARKDGTNGAKAVLQYLADQPPANFDALDALRRKLAALPKPVVTRADMLRLEAVEKQLAGQAGLEEFKFSTNQEMLAAIQMAVAEK